MKAEIDLRIDGKDISGVCVGKTLTLEIQERNSKTVIRINGPFIVKDGQLQLNLSGDRPSLAKEAAVLIGKKVQHAIGREDGTLVINFTDGASLSVPVDPDYEAWEISATDGFMAVSVPGGGLTTWSPRDTTS